MRDARSWLTKAFGSTTEIWRRGRAALRGASTRNAGRNRLTRRAAFRYVPMHPLKGDRAGQWSVRVSGNWRVVFRFEDGEAVDVDLIDYH